MAVLLLTCAAFSVAPDLVQQRSAGTQQWSWWRQPRRPARTPVPTPVPLPSTPVPLPSTPVPPLSAPALPVYPPAPPGTEYLYGKLYSDSYFQAAYTVKDGDLVPEGGLRVGEDAMRRPWRLFKHLVPHDKTFSYVRKYAMYYGSAASMSVGANSDPTRSLDSFGFYAAAGFETWSCRSVTGTTMHEYGHLISLNIDEATQHDERSCPTYYLRVAGCVRRGSMMFQFIEKFYGRQGWADYQRTLRAELTRDDVYNKDPSAFVTRYSATSPAEDFAETFEMLILDRRVRGGQAKINFLQGLKRIQKLKSYIADAMQGDRHCRLL